MSLSNEFTN